MALQDIREVRGVDLECHAKVGDDGSEQPNNAMTAHDSEHQTKEACRIITNSPSPISSKHQPTKMAPPGTSPKHTTHPSRH
jgi:hypothetical protein